MVHYQPNVVKSALRWHQRLWGDADDFRDQLLDLLLPPPPDATPEDVFLRALIELYGDRYVFLRALIGSTETSLYLSPLRPPDAPPAHGAGRPGSDHGSLRRGALRRRRRHG